MHAGRRPVVHGVGDRRRRGGGPSPRGPPVVSSCTRRRNDRITRELRVGDARDVEVVGVGLEPGRRAEPHRRRRARGAPLAQHHRAGHEVAEPLAARRQQRRHDRAQAARAGSRKSTMPTVERMKACRGAVGRALDGDDPETERHLPGRPAAQRHLAQRPGSRRHQRDADDDHDHTDGPGHGEPDDDARARTGAPPWMRTSMQLGHRPRREAGELEVEHHGLGRDDAGGVEGHRLGTVPAGTATPGAGPTVDIDRFITTNQASWTRLEQLTAMAGERAARTRRGRRARAALPAGVHPPVARPHPAGRSGARRAPHPAGRRRPGRALRHPLPLAGRRSPASSPPASRPRCGTPAGSWWSARCCCSCPAILMGTWLARSDAALEAVGAGRAPRGLRGGGLRGVLLLGPGRRSSPPRSR